MRCYHVACVAMLTMQLFVSLNMHVSIWPICTSMATFYLSFFFWTRVHGCEAFWRGLTVESRTEIGPLTGNTEIEIPI